MSGILDDVAEQSDQLSCKFCKNPRFCERANNADAAVLRVHSTFSATGGNAAVAESDIIPTTREYSTPAPEFGG